MADENLDEVIQDTVSSEEEKTEAGGLGWVDLPNFRGDKSKWVDAKTFVERGRHILPIVQENNKRLKGELESERAARRALEEQVAGLRESTEALQQYYAEETNRRVKEVRAEVVARIAEAKEAGDHKAEAELTADLSSLDAEAAAREAAGKGDAKTGKGAPKGDAGEEVAVPVLDATTKAWIDEHPWFSADGQPAAGKDLVKTQRMVLISQELRLDPDNAGLRGQAFFDRCLEVLEERYGPARTSKVGAPRGGGGRSSGKTFADLPKEARDAAHSFNTHRFVGEGKLYPTMKAWEEQYAKDYFAGEQQ